MHRTIAGTVLLGFLAATGSAHADPENPYRFGSPGFIFSGDRLLPLVSYESVKTTQSDGSSETQSHLSVALLNNGPFGAFSTFYNLPRLGFDWIPVRNLTIGGAAWLYTQLTASDTISPSNGPSTSLTAPKVTYWGIAPRIGYIIPISAMFSFWPRAGIEYHNASSSGAGSPSVTQLAFDAEGLLVISAWNHFGFTVGPTADIPISGKSTSTSSSGTGTTGGSTTASVNSAMLQVGLSAGFLGHF
jgi:hypothetical protein